MSRPGTGIERAVVRDAVLLLGLRRRQLVVARRTSACDRRCRRWRSRPRSGRSVARQRGRVPPPHSSVKITFDAVVVEGRRVPVGEVLVDHVIEAHRLHRIRDVEQDAVARAGAGSQAQLREDRDVVALIGLRRLLRARSVVAALPEPRDRAARRIGKDARPADDAGLLGGRERDLDDVDAEERRVRIFLRDRARSSRPAPRQTAPCRCPIRRRRGSPCRSGRRRACACASRGRSARRPPASACSRR